MNAVAPPQPLAMVGAPRRRRASPLDTGLSLLTVLLYLYLYVPILVIIALAFNDSQLTALPLRGFTWRWFGELFNNAHLMDGLRNSVVLGLATVAISVPLGMMLAYAMVRVARRSGPALSAVVILPMLTPRIILAVLLLIFFSFIKVPLSLFTVLLGHVVLTLPFTTLIVAARLRGIDPALEEAAYDLGASRPRIWFHVLLPLLWPAVLAASLIAFTISFDEMVVSFFTIGTESTLPVVIWSMIRYGYTQEINAVSALIIVSTLVLIAIAQRLRRN